MHKKRKSEIIMLIALLIIQILICACFLDGCAERKIQHDKELQQTHFQRDLNFFNTVGPKIDEKMTLTANYQKLHPDYWRLKTPTPQPWFRNK